MSAGLHIIVSHVSGRRMVAQGTDGVSRGCLKEGVAAGVDNMLKYIPLHLSASERNPRLREWLTTWLRCQHEILSPNDWFERGHDHFVSTDARNFWRPNFRSGTFVWQPPPGAAAVALEEMRKAIIKRPISTHLFLCPRLLTTEWRKQLNKTCDLVLFLPAGVDEEGWPLDMYEPLTLGIVFPLLLFAPWQRRGTPKMCHLARQMSGVCKGEKLAARDFLRQLFNEQRALTSMSEHVVRKLLYFTAGD
jgi:hypothetical protein